MFFQEGTHLCESCGRQVLVRRATANHVLHLLLTSLTCSFWLPIWALVALSPGAWRCTVCGRVVARSSNLAQTVVVTLMALMAIPAAIFVAVVAGQSAERAGLIDKARAAVGRAPEDPQASTVTARPEAPR